MAKEGSGRKEEKIVNITGVEGKERAVEMAREQDKERLVKGGTGKERREGSRRERR